MPNESTGGQILIVEDDRMWARLLQFMLNRAGFSTVVAGNGAEALQLAFERRFDFVSVDYEMPEMNGDEFIRALRLDGRHASVPVLMCSAKGYEVNVEALKQQLRLVEFLDKPFSPNEFMAIVAESLDGCVASA